MCYSSLSHSQHGAPNGAWVVRDGSAINISLLTELAPPVPAKTPSLYSYP